MTQVGIVPIQIKPGYRDRFVEAMIGHARRTSENEPGCLRFDVIQDASDPNRIWLLEEYKDEAAAKAHSNASHSAQWSKSPARAWRDEPPIQSARGYSIWPPDEE